MPLPSLGIVERQPIELVLRQCQAIQSEMKLHHAIATGTQMSLVKKLNREGLEEVLILLITKLVNSQHTSQKMSADAIVDCAVDIVSDYWFMKFEEIVIIFNNLRKQKNFNRLDQSVIYEGFTSYQEKERTAAIERARIEAVALEEEAKNNEIKLIREKYAEVAEKGSEILTVNKIKKIHEDEAQQNRAQNNEYLKVKSSWIKGRVG